MSWISLEVEKTSIRLAQALEIAKLQVMVWGKVSGKSSVSLAGITCTGLMLPSGTQGKMMERTLTT
jgi:hypothetical protein